MFADDSAIFADSNAGANNILREIVAITLPYELTVNAEKMRALTADGTPYRDGCQIEQFKGFKYLASMVQQNKVAYTAEVHSRIIGETLYPLAH